MSHSKNPNAGTEYCTNKQHEKQPLATPPNGRRKIKLPSLLDYSLWYLDVDGVPLVDFLLRWVLHLGQDDRLRKNGHQPDPLWHYWTPPVTKQNPRVYTQQYTFCLHHNICLLLELHTIAKRAKPQQGITNQANRKNDTAPKMCRHTAMHPKTIGINQTHLHLWKRKKIKREQHSIRAWVNTLITHPEVLAQGFRTLCAQCPPPPPP